MIEGLTLLQLSLQDASGSLEDDRVASKLGLAWPVSKGDCDVLVLEAVVRLGFQGTKNGAGVDGEGVRSEGGIHGCEEEGGA